MAAAADRYAGGAVTILLAAARAGADAVLAGSVGSGPNGHLIRTTLRAERVIVSSPPVPDLDTGICVVLVEPSAERTFVTTLGAERQVTVESLSPAAPEPGDVVCVSGYSLIEPTVRGLLPWLGTLDGTPGTRRAESSDTARVEVVLDPGAIFAELPGDIRAEALARTTVWTSNAEEAEHLCGVGSLEESPARIAALLRPDAVVVVRDGDRGCAVHVGGPAGRTVVVPGFPRTPVDTNGAGDTHTGALSARIAVGGPGRDLEAWVAAARYANAAAAIKVTRRGPTTAPTASEIDAVLASG